MIIRLYRDNNALTSALFVASECFSLLLAIALPVLSTLIALLGFSLFLVNFKFITYIIVKAPTNAFC